MAETVDFMFMFCGWLQGSSLQGRSSVIYCCGRTIATYGEEPEIRPDPAIRSALESWAWAKAQACRTGKLCWYGYRVAAELPSDEFV